MKKQGLWNSIVGPKSPTVGLWLKCVHSHYIFLLFKHVRIHLILQLSDSEQSKLVMAMGCSHQNQRFHYIHKQTKSCILFFKLNNWISLATKQQQQQQQWLTNVMKLSTISHISWPFDVLLWSACQISQFSTGLPCFLCVGAFNMFKF